MVNGGISQTTAASTPSIQSSTTALAANPARLGFVLQNLGTNTLFVSTSPATASSTVFTVVLKASTGNDDGSGGVLSMEAGVVYTGAITIAGTSPRYTITEFAP